MDQHITVITLGVRDREASRRFYVDGLGWTPALEVEGDVVFNPGLSFDANGDPVFTAIDG